MATTFVTLKQFSEIHLVKSLEIKRNPSTGKLFATVDGTPMKCEQEIDLSMPMTILVEEDGDASNLDDCCLINYTPTEVVGTVQLI